MAPLPSALFTYWIAARSALARPEQPRSSQTIRLWAIRWSPWRCFASAVVVKAGELGFTRLDMLPEAQLASVRQIAPSPSSRAMRLNRPLLPNPRMLTNPRDELQERP